jgi:hypothetical protein
VRTFRATKESRHEYDRLEVGVALARDHAPCNSLPLVEPTEAARCAARAAVAAIDDRCSGYLIGGAGWLADKVRIAAE